ncbi:MAG: hypothetical protein WD066_15925 [Planctomycetaceae bacterium]
MTLHSRATEDFWKLYGALPDAVRKNARKAYHLWRENPSHPSLHFKKVHEEEPLYSVRIGLGWRELGLLEGETVTWFWIASHAEYDRLVERW